MLHKSALRTQLREALNFSTVPSLDLEAVHRRAQTPERKPQRRLRRRMLVIGLAFAIPAVAFAATNPTDRIRETLAHLSHIYFGTTADKLSVSHTRPNSLPRILKHLKETLGASTSITIDGLQAKPMPFAAAVALARRNATITLVRPNIGWSTPSDATYFKKTLTYSYAKPYLAIMIEPMPPVAVSNVKAAEHSFTGKAFIAKFNTDGSLVSSQRLHSRVYRVKSEILTLSSTELSDRQLDAIAAQIGGARLGPRTK